jgi:hypothetical protein
MQDGLADMLAGAWEGVSAEQAKSGLQAAGVVLSGGDDGRTKPQQPSVRTDPSADSRFLPCRSPSPGEAPPARQ